MTKSRLTDLSPEERTLAEQLARVGPRAEPSPALDARVMAAARDASDREREPLRKHRRWPLAVGLVASLVLAVGIAWRVRPLPPSGSPGTPEVAGPVSAKGPAQAPREFATPAPATGVADTAPAVEAATEARSPKPAAAIREKAAAPTASAPDIALDVPTPVEAPTAPTPAPAPPPPPARPVSQAQPAPAPAANAAMDAARVQSDAGSDESGMAAEATPEPGSSDEPMDAMPPATADAPGVRDAWLLRIRTLIDSGDIAGGRRSLRAFAERYPEYPLPEDLRALLR
ncbi:hypothetical protein [Cognatiluteimonas profundi]|uniref:hypothetical protein n=1 Tax=Cognatiluteimonas profundi TaxID=2594501 RepID=UPI00131D6A55|nr:hypothetical protein [Lysobacter profundi]